MDESVADLTSMIDMLKSDIECFGPAGDDLKRLSEYEARRTALYRRNQDNASKG